MSRIASATGARGVVAIPLKGRVPGLPISASLEALGDGYFRGGWWQNDYRAKGIPKLLTTGLFVDQDYATPEAMRSEPFYADYLKRHGFQWSAGLMVEAGGDAWAMMLQRTIEQGPYTLKEQAALRRLIAPLNRAAQLAHSLGEARLTGIADTLDTMRSPSLLLSRAGRVIRISASAERFLGPDLDVRRGELIVPSDAETTARLRSHIAAALWSDLKVASPALAPVIVDRAAGRPLVLRAQPLRKAGLEYFDGCRAILTIGDLNESGKVDSGVLRTLYGLTPREAELCQALVAGSSVSESSDRLKMSIHTTRAHLKQIFAKTDTSSQTGLMILLSRHIGL
ncbi:helix-turn-helix transcriptional regulator [Methylobacterium sp. 77]|uniref:helix-turn-helix transcriptional regulator n=1 Tax=Methylobacterium sp. 77 TaxID=1101192 RepID=UPI001FD87CD7|nr:helix-turn-helix transcriptional regulator [Methylobacterium sp. 77]